jgi:hypothetical protein
MHAPSYPLTHPPFVLVSVHKVIPIQFVPLVVHLSEIKLHEVLEDQVKLLHDVYGKQAPLVPSVFEYPAIHKHGPSDPETQAALTLVLAHEAIVAQNPLAPAVQLVLIP